MEHTIKVNGENYAFVPDGETLGILVGVIDLGVHESSWQDKVSKKPVVRLEFETPKHKNAGGYPAVVSARLTVSAYEKALITPYFAALGITVGEGDSVQDMIIKLGDKMGKAVTIDVASQQIKLKNEDKEVKYNIIKSIKASDVPELEVPKPASKIQFFCQGYHDDKEADNLSPFIKTKINFAPKEEVQDPDGLPF